MFFQIGSTSTNLNTAWASINQRPVLGQSGRWSFIEHSWTLHVFLQQTSLDALNADIAILDAAVKNITGDVVLREDDGTATFHRIPFGLSVSGIRGTLVSYPGGMTSYGGRVFGSGSEMADSANTFRYVVIQLTSRQLFVEAEIIFVQDSYSFSLGGTDFEVQGAFMGPPRRFNIMQQVPGTAVQRGRAIGMTAHPAPATPIGPALSLRPRQSVVTRETPQILGNVNNVGFPTSWIYHFKDIFPLPGTPPTP